jgi:endonuclease G
MVWKSVALAAVLCGCVAPRHVASRRAIGTQYGMQAGSSPEAAEWIKGNCVFGMPKKLAGYDFGNTRCISREGYVLEHSAKDKIPLWVCERVTKDQVSGELKRPKPEPFAPDPLLKGQRRAELKDYRGSGYDRGHQSPSANQTVSSKLQNETYFLSNMAPQFGALNQRIWKSLEEHVRDLAVKTGTVYTVTGPMFYDPAEDEPATADGYVEYEMIGDEVAVPTHFYKIVLWQDAQKKWMGTAFVMPNQKREFAKPYDFDGHIRSIEWVQERTGLDFMPDMESPVAVKLESGRNVKWW